MITVHICTARERRVAETPAQAGFELPLRESQARGGYSIIERIDESVVAPGIRLDRHAHRDVEVLTWVIDGCLDYRDSTGTRAFVLGGELQRVHAGKRIEHNDANASHSEPLHIVQATLRLGGRGEGAHYSSRYFSDDARHDRLCRIASGSGRDDALRIAADAEVYTAVISPAEPLLWYRPSGRRAWLQLARGTLMVNEVLLTAGDAAAVEGDDDLALRLAAHDESELLLFELPGATRE